MLSIMKIPQFRHEIFQEFYCFILDLKVNFESGGWNDCIEETGWRYGKFSCFLASDT